MSRKRIVTLLLVLALVALAAAVSWMAGSSIKSPAEMAARTAPPTPSPILVPVEERVLSSDVVTRGTPLEQLQAYERAVAVISFKLETNIFDPVEARIERELYSRRLK